MFITNDSFVINIYTTIKHSSTASIIWKRKSVEKEGKEKHTYNQCTNDFGCIFLFLSFNKLINSQNMNTVKWFKITQLAGLQHKMLSRKKCIVIHNWNKNVSRMVHTFTVRFFWVQFLTLEREITIFMIDFSHH